MARIVLLVPTHAMTIAVFSTLSGVTSFTTVAITAVFGTLVSDVNRSANEKGNCVSNMDGDYRPRTSGHPDKAYFPVEAYFPVTA